MSRVTCVQTVANYDDPEQTLRGSESSSHMRRKEGESSCEACVGPVLCALSHEQQTVLHKATPWHGPGRDDSPDLYGIHMLIGCKARAVTLAGVCG